MVTIQSVTVRMDKAAVDHFRGWAGPIGLSISRLAKEVQFRQKALAGKKSGLMAASIDVGNKGHWARGIQVEIGTNAGMPHGIKGYSVPNDQGALPHRITPRSPTGMLVFYWAKVGQVVHLGGVIHPGNRPYLWAERGLRSAMAMWSRGG